MLNVAEVDRMVTYLERLLTINWQNTLFTWFCEVSTRVSMTTKPGRMVTYFEILLTIKSFYALITWLCTVFLKDQHSETKKQYRTVSYYWKFAPHSKLSRSFQWLECFIDETEAMTRSSVSTSLSSIHSNSWNWNAHSSCFCRRAATRCGLRRGGWTVLTDCLLGGSEEISDGVVFWFLCTYSCKYTSLIDARYNPHLKQNRLSIVFWAAGQQ